MITADAICIKTLFMENKTITSLTIRRNHIGDEGVAGVCHGLRYNKTVTTLDMYYCGFSVKGIKYVRIYKLCV